MSYLDLLFLVEQYCGEPAPTGIRVIFLKPFMTWCLVATTYKTCGPLSPHLSI